MEAIFEFIGMLLDALFGERFEKWLKKRFKKQKASHSFQRSVFSPAPCALRRLYYRDLVRVSP
jgi:hypothetical protein